MGSTALIVAAGAVAVLALAGLVIAEVGRRPPGTKPGDVDHRWYSRLFTAFDRWRGGA